MFSEKISSLQHFCIIPFFLSAAAVSADIPSERDFGTGLRQTLAESMTDDVYTSGIIDSLSSAQGLSDMEQLYAGDIVSTHGELTEIMEKERTADITGISENSDSGDCSFGDMLRLSARGTVKCRFEGESADGGEATTDDTGINAGDGNGRHCLLTHDFKAVPPVSFFGTFNYGVCRDEHGCTEFWLGDTRDNSLSGSCTVFEKEIGLTVERPEVIRALILDTVYYDDYIQLWVKAEVEGEKAGKDDESGNGENLWVKLINLPNDDFPPETGGRCELNRSEITRLETDIWPMILKAASVSREESAGRVLNLKIRERVSVTGGGEGYMNFRILYDTGDLVEKDYWGNSECTGLFAGNPRAVLGGKCIERISGDESDVNGNDSGDYECIVRSGIRLCSDAFRMPDFFLRDGRLAGLWDPFCRRLDVYERENDLSDDRPEAEGSVRGDRLRKMLASESGKKVPVDERVQQLSDGFPEPDAGIMAAYDVPEENNEGVEEAALLLQTLQYMQSDVVCTGEQSSERSCSVFKGTADTCRKGYFGRMDCCNAPNTADAGTYIRMITYMAALKTAYASLENTSSAMGSWAGGTLMTGSQGLISGTADSVIGSVMDTAVEKAREEFMQAITARLAEIVENTMGEAAKEALFTETVSEEGISMIQMNPAVIGAMQGVMAAYVAYQLAKTLEEIATSCRPNEIETSMKLKLDSCMYTGRSCTEKVLGKCVVYEQRYCCFSSPLARIVMEQLPESGFDFPDGVCGGIPLSRLSEVDFKKIDLSEWLRYVENTDLLDVSRMSVDGLTGSGSVLNVSGRSDSRQRNAERLQKGAKP